MQQMLLSMELRKVYGLKSSKNNSQKSNFLYEHNAKLYLHQLKKYILQKSTRNSYSLTSEKDRC